MRLLIAVTVSLGCWAAWLATSGQSPGWAAPAQEPAQQTVPPRPPSPTPEPLPPVSTAGPPGGSNSDASNPPTANPPSIASPVVNDPSAPSGPAVLPPESGQPGSPEAPPNAEDGRLAPTSSAATATPGPAVPVVASPADLSLNKTVNSSNIGPGEQVQFTLTISNNGPGLATNITVRDLLPVGLAFSTATASQGQYDPGSGGWTVARVGPGEQVTLELVTRAIAPGTITNIAEIVAAGQPDPDSIPGNGLPGEDDRASVEVLVSTTATEAGLVEGAPPVYAQPVTVDDPLSFMTWAGSLSWLYALVLGLGLIMLGVLLVNRA